MTIKTPRNDSQVPSALQKPSAPYVDGIKLNTVDSRTTPLANIINHLSGYPVVGNYYNQVLTNNQEPDGYNPNTFQQRRKVEDLKIYLDSPFDYSISTSNALSSYSSSAKYFLEGIIPIEGDVFTLRVGNGRLGRFEIRGVENLSIFERTAYKFELKLMAFLTPEAEASLDKSVIQKFKYVEDFILNGKSPLLTDQQFSDFGFIRRSQAVLQTAYLLTTFSRGYGTLLVPGQGDTVYDPFVTKFISRLFPQKQTRDQSTEIAVLNADHHDHADNVDIYDVILEQNTELLPFCFRKVLRYPTTNWGSNNRMDSIYYSGISDVVYPSVQSDNVDVELMTRKQLTPNGTLLWQSSNITHENIPLLPVLETGDYVFSNGFYDADESQSLSHIEMQVLNYLNETALDVVILRKLNETHKSWTPVEKYYYCPVLIALLIAAEYSV